MLMPSRSASRTTRRGCAGTAGRRAGAARGGRAPGPGTRRGGCARRSHRRPPSVERPAPGRRCERAHAAARWGCRSCSRVVLPVRLGRDGGRGECTGRVPSVNGRRRRGGRSGYTAHRRGTAEPPTTSYDVIVHVYHVELRGTSRLPATLRGGPASPTVVLGRRRQGVVRAQDQTVIRRGRKGEHACPATIRPAVDRARVRRQRSAPE
jgi:hypothetical protein